MIERDEVIEGWNVAWEHGLWAAPWSRALEGLTAQQAIWKPAPGRHWQEPADVTEAAWLETVRRFEASHQEIVQTLRTADREVERFFYHLFHDNYHIGQIMQLRAMQGFAPIE